MFDFLKLCCATAVLSLSVSGCGSSGEAEYDPSEVPPMSEAEIQAAEDYDAQMEKEFKEQYGN